MLADLRWPYLEWRLQRQALKATEQIYDNGWYDALQLQWPSLEWTGGATIPTKAVLTHWWGNRARAFGSDARIGKQLTAVQKRKPNSLLSQPATLAPLNTVQQEVSTGKQGEQSTEIAGKPYYGKPISRMLDCSSSSPVTPGQTLALWPHLWPFGPEFDPLALVPAICRLAFPELFLEEIGYSEISANAG